MAIAAQEVVQCFALKGGRESRLEPCQNLRLGTQHLNGNPFVGA